MKNLTITCLLAATLAGCGTTQYQPTSDINHSKESTQSRVSTMNNKQIVGTFLTRNL